MGWSPQTPRVNRALGRGGAGTQVLSRAHPNGSNTRLRVPWAPELLHTCVVTVCTKIICSYCYSKRQTSAILSDTHTLWHQQRAQAVSEAVHFRAAADIPSCCASFSCSVTSLASLTLTYISFFPCSSDLDIAYRKAEFRYAATREYILK